MKQKDLTIIRSKVFDGILFRLFVSDGRPLDIIRRQGCLNNP